MGKEFENLVYRLVKDFTFFLKRRPDGSYETRFTSVLNQKEVEMLYKYLDYHKLERAD